MWDGRSLPSPTVGHHDEFRVLMDFSVLMSILKNEHSSRCPMIQNTRQVSVQQHDGNQIITIPQEFASLGSEVILRKEGQTLIIEPLQTQSLLALLTTLPDLSSDEEDFSDVDAELLPLDDVTL